MVRKGGKPNQHALVPKRGHLITYCLSRLWRAPPSESRREFCSTCYARVPERRQDIHQYLSDAATIFPAVLRAVGFAIFTNARLTQNIALVPERGPGISELAAGHR